jgi:hypothetical protein
MDLFTFLIAVMLMGVSLLYEQRWIVFLILVLLIISNANDIRLVILLIVSAAVLFFIQGTEMGILWPLVLVGLLVVAILLGNRPSGEQPEFFAPEMGGGDYGGLLGGM